MSIKTINQSPYLRTSRNFPEEAQPLSVEIDRSYIDIANAVNNRTIGLYPANRPAFTGNSYYISKNLRQETFRQVYTFTSTAAITHDITTTGLTYFPMGHGGYSDGTNWYGLIFGSPTAIPGQVSFYVTPTQIVFTVGAGAPAVSSGIVVVEWMSSP